MSHLTAPKGRGRVSNPKIKRKEGKITENSTNFRIASTLYARAVIAATLEKERNNAAKLLWEMAQENPDKSEDLEGWQEMISYQEQVRIYDLFLSMIEKA